MKNIFVLTMLFFLCAANSVLAASADLTGTWNISSECMRIGDNMDYTAPGVIVSEPHQMVITWQDRNLFKGYACDAETPNGILFGAIDRKEIYITTWDSVNYGSLNGQGNAIEFISQNQLWNQDNAPATCMGTAMKISDTFDCLPVSP